MRKWEKTGERKMGWVENASLIFNLNNSCNHGLEGLLDEAHGADTEEDVLQEPSRTRVGVGRRQQDVLEVVGVAELGLQTWDHLWEEKIVFAWVWIC